MELGLQGRDTTGAGGDRDEQMFPLTLLPSANRILPTYSTKNESVASLAPSTTSPPI
jgi:hypothetical protein